MAVRRRVPAACYCLTAYAKHADASVRQVEPTRGAVLASLQVSRRLACSSTMLTPSALARRRLTAAMACFPVGSHTGSRLHEIMKTFYAMHLVAFYSLSAFQRCTFRQKILSWSRVAFFGLKQRFWIRTCPNLDRRLTGPAQEALLADGLKANTCSWLPTPLSKLVDNGMT